MKNLKNKIGGSLFVVSCLLLVVLMSSATWAVPRMINIQGRIEGDSLPEKVHFNIRKGGVSDWGELKTVVTTGPLAPGQMLVDPDTGIFNVVLGEDSTMIDFESFEDYTLRITIEKSNIKTVLVPDQPLVSTPFSITAGGLAMEAGSHTIVTSPLPELPVDNRAGVIVNDYGGIQTIVKNKFVKENSIVLATFSPPKAGNYYHTLSDVADGEFKLHFYGKSTVRFLVINTNLTPIDYNMPPQTSGAKKYVYLEVAMKGNSTIEVDLVATETNFMDWGVVIASPIPIGALAVDDGAITEINLTQHNISNIINQPQYPFFFTKISGGNPPGIISVNPRIEPDVVNALFDQYGPSQQFAEVDNFITKFDSWRSTIKGKDGHLVAYNVVDDSQQESQENPEEEIEFSFMLTGIPMGFGEFDFGYWADGPVPEFGPQMVIQIEDVMSALDNPAEIVTSQYLDGLNQSFATQTEFDALGAQVGNLVANTGWTQQELQTFLDGNNYLTLGDQTAALSGYATQDWVNGQSFATSGDITTALQGYALQSYVDSTFVTSVALDTALSDYTKSTDLGTLAMQNNISNISAFTTYSSVGNLPAATGLGGVAFVSEGGLANVGVYVDYQGLSWHKISGGTDYNQVLNRPTLGNLAAKNTVASGDIENGAITTNKLDSSVLQNYATISYLDTNFSTKTYVDSTFATSSYLNTTFATKTYVDSELLLRSDLRLKSSITPLSGALDKIKNLRAVSFEWNALAKEVGMEVGKKEIGLIAQEVEPYFPELVGTDSKGYKTLSYSKFTAVLIEAIKEQQKQIEGLQQRIDELEGK